MRGISLVIWLLALGINNVKSQSMCVTAKAFGTNEVRLNGVTIQISENDVVIATQKTEKGMVWLYNCAYGKVYKFTYIQKGYIKRHLVFDLRNIPEAISKEKSSIDVDMTMYKKKELAACKSQLVAWESTPSGTLVFDAAKSEFAWTGEEGKAMKTALEQCKGR